MIHVLGEAPDEIHLIEFPSEHAFEAYRCDPEVVALADRRKHAVSNTEVFVSVEMLDYGTERK